MTGSLIGQKLVAFLAAALEAADRVSTHVIAAAVVQAALVNVCGQEEWNTSDHTSWTNREHSVYASSLKWRII